MKTEDLIELIIILVFLVLSPLLKRFRQKRAGTEAGPDGAPQGPTQPGQPQTHAQLKDYFAYLKRNIGASQKDAESLRLRALDSPLLDIHSIAPLARRLVEVIEEEVDALSAEAAQAIDDETLDPRRLALLREVDETCRQWLGDIRSMMEILAGIGAQRLDPRRAPLLTRLDELAGSMGPGRTPDGQERRLFALVYDGDPEVLASFVGPGKVGIVALPKAHLTTASGWMLLARSVALDYVYQRSELIDELRKTAMIGPLAGRTAAPPYYVGVQFDLAAVVAAWIPQLTADLLGASAMGGAYADAVIATETRLGEGIRNAVTISTVSGRYAPEPPLLMRLAAIDTLLAETGWTQPMSSVEKLRSRFRIGSEARLILPNHAVRRFQLAPLLQFVKEVTQTIVSKKLESLKSRRLGDVFSAVVGPIDQPMLDRCRRDFLEGALPHAGPLILLAGAAMAEADVPDGKYSARNQFLKATEQPKRKPLRKAERRSGIRNDRILLRDALIRAEII